MTAPYPSALGGILSAVYEHTGVARRELAERNRAPRVANARLLAVWVARQTTSLTYAQLSRALNHERRYAIKAYRRACRLIERDLSFRTSAHLVRACVPHPIEDVA